MADKKTDPNYKILSGYVPIDLANRVRKAVKERGITLHEFQEEAALMWLTGEGPPRRQTIFELVARNLPKLKESGITANNLNAIAKGEVLPTVADFCKITSVLKLEDTEKQRLWEETYKLKTNDSTTTEPK